MAPRQRTNPRVPSNMEAVLLVRLFGGGAAGVEGAIGGFSGDDAQARLVEGLPAHDPDPGRPGPPTVQVHRPGGAVGVAAQVGGPAPELPYLRVFTDLVHDRPQRGAGQRPLAQLREQGRRPVLLPLRALVPARPGKQEVDQHVRAGPGGPRAGACGPPVVGDDPEVRPLQQCGERQPVDVVSEIAGDLGGDGREEGWDGPPGPPVEGELLVRTVMQSGDQADRREQTVQRIVEAAGIVIDREGYAGATTWSSPASRAEVRIMATASSGAR